jgi:hypothetical protein
MLLAISGCRAELQSPRSTRGRSIGQSMQQDHGACGHVKGLDPSGARKGHELFAGLERRNRQALLLVAQHQRDRPFVGTQRRERLPALSGSADDAVMRAHSMSARAKCRAR